MPESSPGFCYSAIEPQYRAIGNIVGLGGWQLLSAQHTKTQRALSHGDLIDVLAIDLKSVIILIIVSL